MSVTLRHAQRAGYHGAYAALSKGGGQKRTNAFFALLEVSYTGSLRRSAQLLSQAGS